jgi:hypothetical protein
MGLMMMPPAPPTKTPGSNAIALLMALSIMKNPATYAEKYAAGGQGDLGMCEKRGIPFVLRAQKGFGLDRSLTARKVCRYIKTNEY